MAPTARRNGPDNLWKKPDIAKWPASEEKMFIQLMVNEVCKGNWYSTKFTRVGWEHIQREFCERTNKTYSQSQLLNKFYRLRKSYHEFSELLKQPGCNWDPELNTVIATDGQLHPLLQANRYAYRFWNNGCPMFNELGLIFGKLTAEGKDVFPTAKNSVNSEDESLNATPSAIPWDDSDGKDNPSQSTGPGQGQGLPRVKREADIVEEMIAIVDDAPKERVVEDIAPSYGDTPDVKNPTFLKCVASPDPSEFSISKCVKCLESIEGVGTSEYMKAIKMFKDGEWREMFMAMSAKRRVDWIASLE